MATKLKAWMTIGDTVAIFPRYSGVPRKALKTAMVTYSGPLHIRLDDQSCYAAIGLTSLTGNAGTRIERVRC
jgi:hypothetical protein